MIDPLETILRQAREEQIIGEPEAEALRELAARLGNPQLAAVMHARTLAVLRPIAAREPALRDALYRISRGVASPQMVAQDALRVGAEAVERGYAAAWARAQ